MKYFLLSFVLIITITGAVFSQEYAQPQEAVPLMDKAPVVIEKEGSPNYRERGVAAAPPQLNSIVIDSARNGYGYSSSGPKSIDIATDAITSDDYAGVCYRGFVPGDPNTGIIAVSELNITQGFDIANVSRFDYINSMANYGIGGRFPSFVALPEGPVPIWNQYQAAGVPTTSDAFLSYDFFGWGPYAGGFIPPESWSSASDPNIIFALWLGATDIYQDPNGTFHVGGMWEIDLNSGNYTFIHGTSTDLSTWTWDAGLDPVDAGWTAGDLTMNVPRFAWGSNGFGAWVSTGYIVGTGDTDYKLMLCTTNDYGATWSAVQRYEFSQLGIPENITADDSIFIPDPNNPGSTIQYTGPASVGITYDFDLIVLPTNETHVGCTISWGPPVPNDPNSYYPHGLHMGLYDIRSADVGQNWTDSRIYWNAGLLQGDTTGSYVTINEIDLGYDEQGNIYAGWLDRDRTNPVAAPYPTFNTNITNTYNNDVWASLSTDGGSTWSPVPNRITDDQNNCAAGLNLATRTKWFPQDSGKTYMVYQIADLTRPLPPPVEILADHVQWYYLAEAKGFIPTAIEPVRDQVPQSFALHQNYPNPFNPSTTIRFEVTKSSTTQLNVYNALGQHVATLVNERLSPGVYDYEWDATSLASGVYFYELKTPEFTQVKKMVLMK